MSAVRERLNNARDRAVQMGVPGRRNDDHLYALLAECLSIAEWVDREGLSGVLQDEIRVRVNRRNCDNRGRGRRFAQQSSHTTTLVARWVLGEVDSSQAVYRYARALRAAVERGISSEELIDYLRSEGVGSLTRTHGEQSVWSVVRILRRMAPGQSATVRRTADGRLEVSCSDAAVGGSGGPG